MKIEYLPLDAETLKTRELRVVPAWDDPTRINVRAYDHNAFGRTVRRLREAAGLSREAVAPQVRGMRGKPILPAYLCQIETGHVHPTRRANAAMIASLARAIGCDENELWNVV